MTSKKQIQTAKRNVKKAQQGARRGIEDRSKMGRAELNRVLGHE